MTHWIIDEIEKIRIQEKGWLSRKELCRRAKTPIRTYEQRFYRDRLEAFDQIDRLLNELGYELEIMKK